MEDLRELLFEDLKTLFKVENRKAIVTLFNLIDEVYEDLNDRFKSEMIGLSGPLEILEDIRYALNKGLDKIGEDSKVDRNDLAMVPVLKLGGTLPLEEVSRIVDAIMSCEWYEVDGLLYISTKELHRELGDEAYELLDGCEPPLADAKLSRVAHALKRWNEVDCFYHA